MSDASTVEARDSRRNHCPLCGSGSGRPRRLHEPPLQQCCRCRLVYRLTPLRPVFTGQRDEADLEAVASSRARLFALWLRQRGPASGASLVDVGCGSGSFLDLADAAGWNTIGLELDGALARRARRAGQRVVIANAERAPLRTASAGAVTLWDVLDHFEAPHHAVAEAARILRPGGSLWLRVRHGTVHEMMRRQRWLPRSLSVLHNNMFSPASLRFALADAGFENVRVSPSPTSQGDPYASGSRWLRVAKSCWDATARGVAWLTAGRLIVSPSIAVRATRARAAPAPHA